MSVRCPKCGSSNVVGFKNSYECFDCGYLWKKSTLSRSVTIKKFSIPLWAMLLLISIIVIAAAVPASWRLLAQGGITIKAAPTGSIVIETISPQAGDFGSITLEPGEERAITIDFRVDVVGRAYELEGIYVGYNPYPPYKYLSFQVCTYGTSLDTIHLNRCDNHIIQEGRAYSEEGWTYDKLVLSFPKLRPGVYYFRLLFHIEPSYPEQDISFNFKIYINFREAR
jgi:hypothetical protein